MVLLGLMAIASAVVMTGIARYVQRTKTTEAIQSLTAIGRSSVAFFNHSDDTQPAGASPRASHAMRRFPPTARAGVPEDRDLVRGARYQSAPAEWGVSPWRELGFSLVQPQYYQYFFEASGAGAQASATIRAEGDLDGDGTRSTYASTIRPDENLAAQLPASLTISNAEE